MVKKIDRKIVAYKVKPRDEPQEAPAPDGLFSNTASIGAFFIGTFLLAFVLFVPFMQPLFSVTALTGAQAGFIALLAFIPTFIIQFVKVIVENVRK